MCKILVIGERCFDTFVYGTVDRMSPEGDAPVFVPVYETHNDGMALNTYNNLLALGVNASFVTDNGHISKTRYVDINTNKLYMRLDENDRVDKIDLDILPDLSQFDAVIISDYDKGFLTESDITYIATHSNFTLLDTKKTIGEWVQPVDFIKLNADEYHKNKSMVDSTDWLVSKVIVTLGAGGSMYMFTVCDAIPCEDPDVSGAGDTFIASFAYKYLETRDVFQSMSFANLCAYNVVSQKGVSVVKL